MKSTTGCGRRAGFIPALALLGLAALLGAMVPGTQVRAQAQDSGQPARAVRLSYVDGKVQITKDNKVVTDQAVINTPLFEGMTLTTADDGRAEVQFEDGSVARIPPDSVLTLKVLRGQGASGDADLELDKGLGYFELQGNGQAGQIRVSFGDSVVTGSGFTIVRVSNDTPPGSLAVLSGNAHLERSGGLELDVHGGESATLSASDPNGYNMAESIEPDSWDAWNSDRDQALNSETTAQTNAPADLNGGGQTNNPAWSDLDANGSWYNVPDQGYVWSPYDASDAGFDPYGNGNWVYSPGFGYTWASAYSWGYLPYQCGAWNFYGGFGWGWAPGMGGCSPWWGMGFYPGAVIGFAPGWYVPPIRPINPHGPGRIPHPIVPVNRRPMVLNAGLPARGLNSPVAFNGRMVTALRPMPSASGNGRAMFGGGRAVYSGAIAAGAGGRPGYVPSRQAYAPGARGVASPYSGYGGYGPATHGAVRSYSAPSGGGSYHPSGGGGSYHPSGGGGGGASHGGGGGGASHGGGGGGRK